MFKKMAFVVASGAALLLLANLPASAAPMGAAGKVVDAKQGTGVVEQVHRRRWHRHRHRYYSYRYRPYYRPYYYRPYRYYYPYYSYGYPYYYRPYRYHRRPGVSIYLNF